MNDVLSGKLLAILERIEPLLPPKQSEVDWNETVAALWERHPLIGGQLVPVALRDDVRLDDLVGIERQKREISENTRAFLAGKPANHALLWGARGTGKSSIIRALLNEMKDEGLRLIQVDRYDLIGLPGLVARLRNLPQRFIVYCDDLSFEGSDDAYKSLKSVLDGTLTGPPENVLIYATSNRRHLLPEASADNNDTHIVDGELHHGDAVEEKVSLSDRFGLWLAFHAFNQDTFIAACEHWVRDLGGEWNSEAKAQALQYGLLRGVRSGRAAWQFACKWVGSTDSEG